MNLKKPPLEGRRVALLEARMSGELAELIRRSGGVPVQTPAVREAAMPAANAVASFLARLAAGEIDVVVFLTGAGASALLAEAERQDALDRLVVALRTAKTVCRGPKPVAVLHRYGVVPSFSAGEPFTSTELLAAITSLDLHDRGVGLVHYGERDSHLFDVLIGKGAVVHELCLYEWLLPIDLAPMKALVRDIVAGHCDAVVFTSQIQCRHLFEVAALEQLDADLVVGLNERTIVASVGPVCTAALNRFGVVPHVCPPRPKMAPLVAALGEHFLDAAAWKGTLE